MPDGAEFADIAPLTQPLPPIQGFDGRELVEALFLEDSKPVVVFDAPRPEQIAVRLLSALWPGLRERFSISTFALSPRKVEGEFFDVVFAPNDAKARFTNWHGRRIDARSEPSSRHRWTGAIVQRVFKDNNPRLLSRHGLEALERNELSAPSALRISLLWEELLDKLQASPSAALGLIDVANSKFSRSATAVEVLPLVANAVFRAAREMEPADGWAFVAAMLRKVQNTSFSTITPAIADAGRVLARRSPGRAISFIEQPDVNGSYAALMPKIAGGLSDAFHDGAEQALEGALPETLADVLGDDNNLARSAVRSPALLNRISEILPALSPAAFNSLRETLLPILGKQEQMELAGAFIRTLSRDQLLDEIDNLARIRSVPDGFAREIVDRARILNDETIVREKALHLRNATITYQLLTVSLTPVSGDVRWVLDRLPSDRSNKYLVDLLLAASNPQMAEIFADHELAHRIVPAVGVENLSLVLRIASEVRMPLDLLVAIVQSIDDKTEESEALSRVTRSTLQRCLREHFVGEEIAFLLHLLKSSPAVDAAWLIHHGLAGNLISSVVSRNIRMLNLLEGDIRTHIVKSIDVIGEVLSGRWRIDLDADAAIALTNLLVASEQEDQQATLRASGHLLPALIRSRDWPVSPVIAATFPFVYAELAREDDVPDLLRFMPFFDWDRCKAARHELVEAFLSAKPWRPRDFASTVCRCQDAERFIKRLLRERRGEGYVRRIQSELSALPVDCANYLSTVIADALR